MADQLNQLRALAFASISMKRKKAVKEEKEEGELSSDEDGVPLNCQDEGNRSSVASLQSISRSIVSLPTANEKKDKDTDDKSGRMMSSTRTAQSEVERHLALAVAKQPPTLTAGSVNGLNGVPPPSQDTMNCPLTVQEEAEKFLLQLNESLGDIRGKAGAVEVTQTGQSKGQPLVITLEDDEEEEQNVLTPSVGPPVSIQESKSRDRKAQQATNLPVTMRQMRKQIAALEKSVGRGIVLSPSKPEEAVAKASSLTPSGVVGASQNMPSSSKGVAQVKVPITGLPTGHAVPTAAELTELKKLIAAKTSEVKQLRQLGTNIADRAALVSKASETFVSKALAETGNAPREEQGTGTGAPVVNKERKSQPSGYLSGGLENQQDGAAEQKIKEPVPPQISAIRVSSKDGASGQMGPPQNPGEQVDEMSRLSTLPVGESARDKLEDGIGTAQPPSVTRSPAPSSPVDERGNRGGSVSKFRVATYDGLSVVPERNNGGGSSGLDAQHGGVISTQVIPSLSEQMEVAGGKDLFSEPGNGDQHDGKSAQMESLSNHLNSEKEQQPGAFASEATGLSTGPEGNQETAELKLLSSAQRSGHDVDGANKQLTQLMQGTPAFEGNLDRAAQPASEWRAGGEPGRLHLASKVAFQQKDVTEKPAADQRATSAVLSEVTPGNPSTVPGGVVKLAFSQATAGTSSPVTTSGHSPRDTRQEDVVSTFAIGGYSALGSGTGPPGEQQVGRDMVGRHFIGSALPGSHSHLIQHPTALPSHLPGETKPMPMVPPAGAVDLSIMSSGPIFSPSDWRTAEAERMRAALSRMRDEEEALDAELDAAQQQRRQSEIEERLARKIHRKAEEALDAANTRCHELAQRRHALAVTVRMVEMQQRRARGALNTQVAGSTFSGLGSAADLGHKKTFHSSWQWTGPAPKEQSNRSLYLTSASVPTPSPTVAPAMGNLHPLTEASILPLSAPRASQAVTEPGALEDMTRKHFREDVAAAEVGLDWQVEPQSTSSPDTDRFFQGQGRHERVLEHGNTEMRAGQQLPVQLGDEAAPVSDPARTNLKRESNLQPPNKRQKGADLLIAWVQVEAINERESPQHEREKGLLALLPGGAILEGMLPQIPASTSIGGVWNMVGMPKSEQHVGRSEDVLQPPTEEQQEPLKYGLGKVPLSFPMELRTEHAPASEDVNLPVHQLSAAGTARGSQGQKHISKGSAGQNRQGAEAGIEGSTRHISSTSDQATREVDPRDETVHPEAVSTGRREKRPLEQAGSGYEEQVAQRAREIRERLLRELSAKGRVPGQSRPRVGDVPQQSPSFGLQHTQEPSGSIGGEPAPWPSGQPPPRARGQHSHSAPVGHAPLSMERAARVTQLVQELQLHYFPPKSPVSLLNEASQKCHEELKFNSFVRAGLENKGVVVEVYLGGEKVAEAAGPTKKAARLEATQAALGVLARLGRVDAGQPIVSKVAHGVQTGPESHIVAKRGARPEKAWTTTAKQQGDHSKPTYLNGREHRQQGLDISVAAAGEGQSKELEKHEDPALALRNGPGISRQSSADVLRKKLVSQARPDEMRLLKQQGQAEAPIQGQQGVSGVRDIAQLQSVSRTGTGSAEHTPGGSAPGGKSSAAVAANVLERGPPEGNQPPGIDPHLESVKASATLREKRPADAAVKGVPKEAGHELAAEATEKGDPGEVAAMTPELQAPATRNDVQSMRRGDNGASIKSSHVLPHGYESPLVCFKNFPRIPRFRAVWNFSPTSPTWRNSIEPQKPLCKFELFGRCNDKECPWQHFAAKRPLPGASNPLDGKQAGSQSRDQGQESEWFRPCTGDSGKRQKPSAAPLPGNKSVEAGSTSKSEVDGQFPVYAYPGRTQAMHDSITGGAGTGLDPNQVERILPPEVFCLGNCRPILGQVAVADPARAGDPQGAARRYSPARSPSLKAH